MNYFFKPDWTVIAITILAIPAIYLMWKSLSVDKWYFVTLVAVVTLLFIYFVAQTPLYLRIDSDKIKIKQLVGSVTFDLNTVQILPLQKDDLKNTIRIFGNGGIGGYTGWYSSSGLGKFYMLAINQNELAKVITGAGKIYVINYPAALLEND